MKNKGFTLIELLAVIVILAIIALIATPIILNIIDNAKEESDKRSIDMYAKAVENAIVEYQLKYNKAPKNFEELVDKVNIKYEGPKVECEHIEISNRGKITLASCKKDGQTINYVYGEVEESDTLYTGEIYIGLEESLSIGDYINVENKWSMCIVLPDGTKECNTTDIFGSKTECEIKLEEFKEEASNSGELSEEQQMLLENMTCEQGAVSSTLSYETNLSNITQYIYLKHDVENDKVVASYVCYRYAENEISKDICLRGVDSSYYESNQTSLLNLQSYFNTLMGHDYVSNGYCSSKNGYTLCDSSHLELYAYPNGYVYAYQPGWGCYVNNDGSSYCEIP